MLNGGGQGKQNITVSFMWKYGKLSAVGMCGVQLCKLRCIAIPLYRSIYIERDKLA